MADLYAFLELEGIEGESQDSDYENKIAIDSFSWGATNASSYHRGTGAGTGKGEILEIHFTKTMDKSSPKLMERVATGQHIPSGKVSLVKLSGDSKIPYYQVELTDIVVSTYQVAAHSGNHLPSESFSLSFVKTMVHYQPQGNEGDPAGNVEFGWNLQQSKSA
jgi:type VI secretion system secreted protein Hcp